MDLFDWKKENTENKDQVPLAERMKPRTLDEFIGQSAIMGEGKLLPAMIAGDRLGSIILHGPPGSGKTSLARIIANTSSAHSDFITLNAVTSGVKDIREAVERAAENQSLYGRRTFVFIDEIHRFNKLQQDALLPYVENGQIVLIGATTENPYFEVNSALISRSSVFRLTPLADAEIATLIRRALSDVDRGYGTYRIAIDDDVIEEIAALSSGDARRALNILEMAVNAKSGRLSREIRIERSDLFDGKKGMYDKKGDNHYDIVSAFIKSMRGSDPDAAVHYLARMIAGGEDPMFIARRIVICASEDVGNADPAALPLAVAAMEAVRLVGMPEGRIPLSQAAIYIACAPKSNAAYLAIDEAIADVESADIGRIPYYLRDGTSLSLERRYSAGEPVERYRYPHDYEGGYIEQKYLPEPLEERRYYRPKPIGAERGVRDRLRELRPHRAGEESSGEENH